MPIKFVKSLIVKNPSLSVIIAEGFLARLGFGVVTFALPFYALSLGMNLTEIGFLSALRLITAIAIKPVMGWASDRLGKKNIYVWSVAGRCFVGLFLAIATTPTALFIVRFFHGITTAARDPSSTTLIVEHGDENKMASAFAWYNTAKEAGASFGYLIAGLLLALTHDHYPAVFLFSVLTSIVSFILVLLYVKEFRGRPDEKNGIETNSVSPASWMEYALLALLIATGGNMVTALFPIIATVHGGLSKTETSVIFSLSTFVIIFAGPFFGWLSDHVSRKIVVSIRAIANALSSILYALTPGFVGLTMARVADDTGKAAFRPAWGSIIAEVSNSVDKKKRGRLVSYLDTSNSIGEAMGPVLAGWLWDWKGIYVMLAFRFIFSILTEIYTIWLIHYKSGSNFTETGLKSESIK